MVLVGVWVRVWFRVRVSATVRVRVRPMVRIGIIARIQNKGLGLGLRRRAK